MTRNEEELSRDEHIDQRALVDCIKNDFFLKAKSAFGEDAWDVGGVTHEDCIKCCRGRVGLQTMTRVERHSHVEKARMRALSKKTQKKALAQKRSATCAVMQSKFTGAFLNRGRCWRSEGGF